MFHKSNTQNTTGAFFNFRSSAAGIPTVIGEGSKTKKIFADLTTRLKDYTAPTWVNFDLNKMEGKVLAKPKNTEVFFDLNAVLEFYSR